MVSAEFSDLFIDLSQELNCRLIVLGSEDESLNTSTPLPQISEDRMEQQQA